MPVNEELVASLEGLAAKYRELLDLRRRREELEGQGVLRLEGDAALARRQQLRSLSRRFPGALRELETLSASAVAARLEDLAEELDRARRWPEVGAPERRWIRVVLDYHAALRDGLAIRRWLGAQPRQAGAPSPELVQRFRAWYVREGVGAAEVDAAFLARYLAPPQGRLTELVWLELASRHGCSVSEVRLEVLGTAKRGKGRRPGGSD